MIIYLKIINTKEMALSKDIIEKIYTEEGDYAYFIKKYNVSRKTVIRIKSKLTHLKITANLGKAGHIKRYGLTSTDIEYIQNSSSKTKVLSNKFNVTYQTIRNIRDKDTRKFLDII